MGDCVYMVLLPDNLQVGQSRGVKHRVGVF